MPTLDTPAATAVGPPRPIASALWEYPAIYLPLTPGSVREEDTVPFDAFIELSDTAYEVLMHYRWRTSQENAADLRRLKPAVYEALFTNRNRLRTPYFAFPGPIPGSLSSLHRSKKFVLGTLARDLCSSAFPPGATITHGDGRGPVAKSIAAIAAFYFVPQATKYWQFNVPEDFEPAQKPPDMVKGRFIV